MIASLPPKPGLEGLEDKWRVRWEEEGTYKFDRTRTRDEVFSIDTPPPTVSGRLHIGHVFSYTHTDLVARYQRMTGKEVFYPIGWDDNGLNVERRVQLMTGTMVDPSLPYDPAFEAPAEAPKRPLPVSRPNFIELCQQIVPEMEASYHELWSRLGLSIDWSFTYTTIGPYATKVSQRAFLRLLEKGVAYRAESPTLWDVDLRTAVAQAELEDREVPGVYQRIVFQGPGGSDLLVDTTRPELLPACVALVAHPDDQRYKPLFGKRATTPLFGVSVPIVAHHLGDPEKGTGLAMICTFGDATDVIWWRELNLETRALVERNGTMRAVDWGQPGFESDDAESAHSAYDQLTGRSTKQAKDIVTRLLAEANKLAGEPRPITHSVKFWENGTRPLEIVTSDQWFIRYPDKDVLIELGRQVNWVPDFMRLRYENWVTGLSGDWNITRQRYFGVPFPIWYPIGFDGQVDYLAPIAAPAEMLPVDPSTDTPPGFQPAQRNQPGGFAADADVMDTWATSSLSPQIITGYLDDPDLFSRTSPMDLRPQSHDIIRTWLFSTIVRAHYEFGAPPWKNAAISGFVIDPDRKKLSKSAGNSPNDPVAMLERFGADAVRYWAAQGRPGTDIAFDEGQLKIGRRLATKVLNASRFVLGLTGDASGEPTEPLDLSLLSALANLVEETEEAFENLDYARAIERTEEFFWPFCDDYLELVKGRAYADDGNGSRSARAALAIALETLLKLFAPFLPYVTEEVWSWWKEGSIHRSAWPKAHGLRRELPDRDGLWTQAGAILSLIRKAKTDAQASMKAPLATVTVRAPADTIEAISLVANDLRSAGVITGDFTFETADDLAVEAVFA